MPEPDGVLYPSSFNNGTDAPSISMVPCFGCFTSTKQAILGGTEADFIVVANGPARNCSGEAKVCDVFVCAIWKAAGLFKEIDNDFSSLSLFSSPSILTVAGGPPRKGHLLGPVLETSACVWGTRGRHFSCWIVDT